MSGDAGAEAVCHAAGADGFIEKPISSLSAFQNVVISHLPPDMRPTGMRLVSNDSIDPDPLALLDDLAHVSDLLTDSNELDQASIRYAVQFLQGLARLTDDRPLSDVADQLSAHHFSGEPISSDIARFAGLVQQRITQQRAV